MGVTYKPKCNELPSPHPIKREHSKTVTLKCIYSVGLRNNDTVTLPFIYGPRTDDPFDDRALVAGVPVTGAVPSPALLREIQTTKPPTMVERTHCEGRSRGHCTAICLEGLRKLAKSRPRCEASTSGTQPARLFSEHELPAARTHTVALG